MDGVGAGITKNGELLLPPEFGSDLSSSQAARRHYET